jgi:hypothetical protein
VHSHSTTAIGRNRLLVSNRLIGWTQSYAAAVVCHKQNIHHARPAAALRFKEPKQRTNTQVLFGLRGDEPSASASVLGADTLRWAPAPSKGAHAPLARLSHAAACVRERVYVFGGMTGEGHLLGDLWSLDVDTMQWQHHITAGTIPCPRKGEAAGLG